MPDAKAETKPPRRADEPGGTIAEQPSVMRPIPERAIWWGTGALLLVAAISTALLITFFGAGTPRDKIRLQAIQLAGSIAVGTGGAAALVLAARRQRATELGLLHQERAAADTRHDAEERRISDLQASIGEQLGNDKAAVRLNALYQLERLGQSHPDHRQTVVNVLCAYLRMPFTHPNAETPAAPVPAENSAPETPTQQPLLLDLAPTLAAATGLSLDGVDQQRQELQVRLTAQRILADHLRPDPDEDTGEPTNTKFWPHMNLDLTGAVLIDFNLSRCHVTNARFNRARFHDGAEFNGTVFHDEAEFNGAHFHDLADFTDARFHMVTRFFNAHFHKDAEFNGVEFHYMATFGGAQFHETASFRVAEFLGSAVFLGVRFHNEADFVGAHFHKWAEFLMTQFHDEVDFDDTQFHSLIWFEEAQFHHSSRFDDARCRLDATRNGDVWPAGWTVQPPDSDEAGRIDGQDGIWGRFMRESDQHEPNEAESEPRGTRSTETDSA